MNRITISVCAFADDVATIANSEKKLEESLKIWKNDIEINKNEGL